MANISFRLPHELDDSENREWLEALCADVVALREQGRHGLTAGCSAALCPVVVA